MSKLIQEIRELTAITVTNPREIIIENPYTAFAGSFGTIASLVVSFYAPSELVVIFILSLGIFFYGLIIESQKYLIYTQKSLPIPVVININNPKDSLDALNSLFSVIQQQHKYDHYSENIQKYLGIHKEDLVYKYGGDIFDKENLKQFLKFTKHDLERVKRRTPQNSTFYLAYIGPISVAFLVGSMLAREGMYLFQIDQSNHNSYQCVMVATQENLRKDIAQFDKFDVSYKCSEPPQSKVTIAIDAAVHPTKLDDPSILNYGDLIHLKHKTGNTIPYDKDWTQYCREIHKIIEQSKQKYQEIKLVYSLPVSLGIAVGMTTQHFGNILLTNYDSKTGTYQDLIRMNEIDYHF